MKRKKIKVEEADNGFIVRCFMDESNVLASSMPIKVEVFTDKQALQEFISGYFSSKEIVGINSNALQEEEMQDQGEY